MSKPYVPIAFLLSLARHGQYGDRRDGPRIKRRRALSLPITFFIRSNARSGCRLSSRTKLLGNARAHHCSIQVETK